MRYINIMLIIMLAVLQYDLWIGEGSMASVWHLRDRIQQQHNKNTALKARNDALVAEVNDLKSGLSAIEARARNELGMIKKGETFIQIVEPSKY